jgi:5-methylcytosine-specific restriction endonuclease McrA
VRQRDGHKCRVCLHQVTPGAPDPAKRAEVHHLRPRSTAPERKHDPANLVTVCGLCHSKLTAHLIEWEG